MPNVTANAYGTPSLMTLDAAANTNTVTFTSDLNNVTVITVGAPAADIWWTCDGTQAAVGVGYYIPSGSQGIDTRQPPNAGPTVVSLYSAGSPVVRVQRGD